MENTGDAVVIINPTAGRGRAGKEAANIRHLLGAEGAGWRWHYTTGRGDAEHAARAAAEAGASLIVSVGGDGTLHEVVNGVLGTDATLGLIPFGTGNDLARALGLHGDIALACKAVTSGITRRIDVGAMQGVGTDGPRHFFVMGGTGYLADTAHTVNSGIKYLSGAAAYVWGAVLTLMRFTPFQMTVEADGEKVFDGKAMFLAVANTPMTGGGMLLAPGATVDDGWFDLCLVRELTRPALLYQLTKVFPGEHVKHPAVTMLRARSIKIETDPPQRLWLDGETLGTTPATVQILPGALPIRVPATVL